MNEMTRTNKQIKEKDRKLSHYQRYEQLLKKEALQLRTNNLFLLLGRGWSDEGEEVGKEGECLTSAIHGLTRIRIFGVLGNVRKGEGGSFTNRKRNSGMNLEGKSVGKSKRNRRLKKERKRNETREGHQEGKE